MRAMQVQLSSAVEAYATFWASFGVTTIIELRHPSQPADSPASIRLFADWPTAKRKLRVAVVDEALDEIELLEKPDREAN